MGKLLIVEEVAEQLRVSTRTVTRYIDEGKIKAVKLDKCFRIYEEDVKEYLDTHKYDPNK